MTDLQLYNKLNNLPYELKKEAEDFIEFLYQKKKIISITPKPKRMAGLAKSLIKIKSNFDDPIEF